MKILLLANDDVSAYYSAALMLRGHQIITHDRGVSRSENSTEWTSAIEKYMECDGCLLISDDPQMRGLADWFGNSGKPVWHHLADVPGIEIRRYRLLYVLVPLLLLVVGALIIKQPWFREEAKPPVAVEEKPAEEKPPIASEVTAPVVDNANDATLRVSCDKCGRDGCYGLAKLIDKRGRNGKLVDWLEELTADCPKKKSLLNMSD